MGLLGEHWVVWTSGVSMIGLFLASRLWSPLLFKRYPLLGKSERRDWDGRYHSTVHAIISVVLSVIALKAYVQQELNAVQWATPFSTATLQVSLGYFLSDMCMIALYPELGGPPMIAHHLVAVTCLVAALYLNGCHYYALYTLTSEVTTPFINLRWWLDKLGLKASKLYLYNGLLLMISWMLVRVVLLSYLFKHLYDNYTALQTLPTGIFELIGVAVTVMFGLNVYWGEKILRGGMKVLLGAKKAKAHES